MMESQTLIAGRGFSQHHLKSYISYVDLQTIRIPHGWHILARNKGYNAKLAKDSLRITSNDENPLGMPMSSLYKHKPLNATS